MSVLAVIPARYGSVRFPGKPLASLRGKPVIQHVYEQVAKAVSVSEVVVATDDERIIDAVKQFHGIAVMTSPTARSGSERVAEVARARTERAIINIQGDEPLIQPDMVDQVAQFLEQHPAVPMASLMTRLEDLAAAASPNVVKVVVDRDGYALYFSRSPIPFIRQQTSDIRPQSWKHIGLYGYQRNFLLQFPTLPPTPLEQAEQLEQLRALEHGYRIKLLETAHDTVGVDTPEDLAKVETLLTAASG